MMNNEKMNNYNVECRADSIYTNIFGLDSKLGRTSGIVKRSVGRPKAHHTDEERKISRKSSNSRYYRKITNKYRKDTDKALSVQKATYNDYAKFFGDNYAFTHAITLTTGVILDKKDKKATKTSEDYHYNILQQKYQIKPMQSLRDLKRKFRWFLEKMKKDGEKVYSHHVVTYEQDDNQNWHIHVAINITDKTVVNPYTFIYNRWPFCNNKGKKVKKMKSQPWLTYMTKDIEKNENKVLIEEFWDTDINKKTSKKYQN